MCLYNTKKNSDNLLNRYSSPGCVYWITGLSGAGKTSLCQALVSYLQNQGDSIIMLDGDDLREVMGSTDAHTREERLMLARRYAHLCHLLSKQGVDVAIATISMFREIHEWNRINLSKYVEIFLNVPLDELSRRDPKKIYERVYKGELKNVAGVDFIVDKPASPDVSIEWVPGLSVDIALGKVIEYLKWRIGVNGN